MNCTAGWLMQHREAVVTVWTDFFLNVFFVPDSEEHAVPRLWDHERSGVGHLWRDPLHERCRCVQRSTETGLINRYSLLLGTFGLCSAAKKKQQLLNRFVGNFGISQSQTRSVNCWCGNGFQSFLMFTNDKLIWFIPNCDNLQNIQALFWNKSLKCYTVGLYWQFHWSIVVLLDSFSNFNMFFCKLLKPIRLENRALFEKMSV